jgi:hypothetical protein
MNQLAEIGLGTKSASKMAISSPFTVFIPFSMPGLESSPIVTMNVMDVETLPGLTVAAAIFCVSSVESSRT